MNLISALKETGMVYKSDWPSGRYLSGKHSCHTLKLYLYSDFKEDWIPNYEEIMATNWRPYNKGKSKMIKEDNMNLNKMKAVVVTIKDFKGNSYPQYVCLGKNADEARYLANKIYPDFIKNHPKDFFNVASSEVTVVSLFCEEK
jgi:hypothetical protein